jgi:hypothetical protein
MIKPSASSAMASSRRKGTAGCRVGNTMRAIIVEKAMSVAQGSAHPRVNSAGPRIVASAT